MHDLYLIYHLLTRCMPAVNVFPAINAGNSGGPAIMGDKVVGVAFETLEVHSHAECILRVYLAGDVDDCVLLPRCNSCHWTDPDVLQRTCVLVLAQQDAENIGYVIPTPIVLHFLEDIELHGEYRGFCVMGFAWQITENINVKKFFKMTQGVTSALVCCR